MADLKKYAIIAAGGSGRRMGNGVPKQFLLLQGKPVLWYSLNAFLESYKDLQIILVLPEGQIEAGLKIVQSTDDPGRIQTVKGGTSRFHSVKNGLEKISEPSIVLVHDAVRCLLTPALIHRCHDLALEKGNAVPAIAVADSVRIETQNGFVPLDRNKIRIIQTPQAFQSGLIKKAYQQEYLNSFTDDASVVERTGVTIHLTKGEEENIKLTFPIDLQWMDLVLKRRGQLRSS